jgi:iduronate 2-sulfatase
MIRQLRFIYLLLPAISLAAPHNVLFIAVDDLRPWIGAYGADFIQTPHMDALAAGGRLFERHYVQAPTCGASRYALLTGQFGDDGNGALIQRGRQVSADPKAHSPSLPVWFRQHGYQTVAVGKISHHPGGLAGENWSDPKQVEMPDAWDRSYMPSGPWLHPRGAMHGLANGQIRRNAGDMDVFEAFDGSDMAYPDGWITEAAVAELNSLSATEEPFFLAVGIIRPHLPFGAPSQYLDSYANTEFPPIPHPNKPKGLSTWHPSGEFMKYNRWGKDPNTDADFADDVRRHYAASVTYADAQIGRILAHLESLGLDENTVVVLWGDHGWHLGEHAIWGKHALFEESLHAPLIIRAPDLTAPGQPTAGIASTVDIFPTLCDLAGLPVLPQLDGRSLRGQLENPGAPGRPAVSYFRGPVSLRTETHRLTVHENGATELYDHTSPEKETRNLAADQTAMVQQLAKDLHRRAPGKMTAAMLVEVGAGQP